MQAFDRALLCRAKGGDEAAIAALIARMMPLIRRRAAACVGPGLDFEDAVQEGLIGLFDAVRRCDTAKSDSFVGYAAACIAHAQTDARRTASRKKHAPLNYSVPLPEDSSAPGPEELAAAGERFSDVLEKVRNLLSPFECDALFSYASGMDGAKIAQQLGRSPKAVENALVRARRKLQNLNSCI
jgi:RNA polymerase sporulation-specific sigma factor